MPRPVPREVSAPPYKTHRCAARGCQDQVGPGTLMCSPHWRLVPQPLRVEVYRTWEARQRWARRLLTNRLAWLEYQAATQAHRLAVTVAVQLVEDTQEAPRHAESQLA